jgi:hypothetical protein
MVLIAPKRLVSKLRRICSSLYSSNAPISPYPALLTDTSIRPQTAIVDSIAYRTSWRLVTSKRSALALLGY